MCSVILFMMITWMIQGCISIGYLRDDSPNSNFSSELGGSTFNLHAEYLGGGAGFIPETPSSGEKSQPKDTRGKKGLKLDKLGNASYYFSTEKFIYHKALQFCKFHQMDLLNIETEEESNLITGMLRRLKTINYIWTSGTDLQKEGEYVWMSTGEPFTFTNWEPNQPDNYQNIEHCIQIRKYNEKDYYWNDSYCSNEHNFICEASNCPNSCKC